MNRLLLACTALVWFPAYAHNYHQSITAVEYNERTQSLELVHTLVAHDLEAALIRNQGKALDLGQADIEPILQGYVDEHVQLKTMDGGKQSIAWVGYEIEAQQVRIFQEIKDFTQQPFNLSNTLLFDLHKNQRNTVNINMAGTKLSKTLIATDNNVNVN